MRTAAGLCLALAIAGCGAKNDAQNRAASPIVLSETPQNRPELDGPSRSVPVSRMRNLPIQQGSATTGQAVAVTKAVDALPADRRALLLDLLKCEEAKMPIPVPGPERPRFVRKGLETLAADPDADAHCRVGTVRSTR